MTSHALYLDDSGTKDYSPTDTYLKGEGHTRYFVFAGILATQDAASQLAQALKITKRRASGGVDFELKSNWLRMPHERKRRYLVPHKLTDAELTQLVDDVYDEVLKAEVELLACVVDKVHMREDYGEKAYYPPALAYEALAQRVQNSLGGKGTCQVFMDDMTGKNPKGNAHKKNLIQHHARLRIHGSTLRRAHMTLDSLGDLRFLSSAISELIQVADLVAYNVYRQFVEHGEEWERIAPTLPAYNYFDRLAPMFRRGPNNRVQGYGIVKMPLRRRIPWAADVAPKS